MKRALAAVSDTAQLDTDVVRLSVNLSRAVAGELLAIKTKRNSTATAVIGQAISTLKYLEDAASRGARILIEDNGEVREIVLR